MLPTMITDRLILQPRTMDDLDECVKMDKDPEVTEYIPGVWDGSEKHIIFLKDRIGYISCPLRTMNVSLKSVGD